MQALHIPLASLVSLGNVRQVGRDPETESLARSMANDGLEVPINVYPVSDGQYGIKHGHRRVAAALMLNWSAIDAVVSEPPADEAAVLVSQYNENEQRLGLSYLEKAQVYARLKEIGWSQRLVAQKFGISDADVSLALATLRADPKLQKAIEEGRIRPSAVEPLLSQPQEIQAALADAAIRAKTVRGVSALVKAHKAKAETYAMTDETERGANLSDDADPIEQMAVEAINEAVESLRIAQQTPITDPALVRQVRPSVKELMRLAQSLKGYLGE